MKINEEELIFNLFVEFIINASGKEFKKSEAVEYTYNVYLSTDGEKTLNKAIVSSLISTYTQRLITLWGVKEIDNVFGTPSYECGDNIEEAIVEAKTMYGFTKKNKAVKGFICGLCGLNASGMKYFDTDNQLLLDSSCFTYLNNLMIFPTKLVKEILDTASVFEDQNKEIVYKTLRL